MAVAVASGLNAGPSVGRADEPPPPSPPITISPDGAAAPLAQPLTPAGPSSPATPSGPTPSTGPASPPLSGDPGEPVGGERSDFGLLDAVLGDAKPGAAGTPAAAMPSDRGPVGPGPATPTIHVVEPPATPAAPALIEVAPTAKAPPARPVGDPELPPAARLPAPGANKPSPAAPMPAAGPSPARDGIDPSPEKTAPATDSGESRLRIVEPAATPEPPGEVPPGGQRALVRPVTPSDGAVQVVPVGPAPGAAKAAPIVEPWQSVGPSGARSAPAATADADPATRSAPVTASITDTERSDADTSSAPPAVPPATIASPGLSADDGLDPTSRALRDRIRAIAEYYRLRPENAATRSPWGVMHAFLPYGVEADVLVGDRKLNAIGYCCWNGACRGMSLFYIDPRGQLGARVGPGYQGHEGQFLAMLAQCRIDPKYEIRVDGQRRTIFDLVAYEQSTCKPKTELTFKLMGLAHYVGTEATWSNSSGTWNVERLLAEEMAQPINGVACGGTHRLMAIAFAVQQREMEGRPLTPTYQRAKRYVADYHRYTMSLQNPDGTFSTDWFEGRGMDRDFDRRVQTTGHILEWMVYTLPPEQLRDPRIVRTVWWLLTTMEQNANYKFEVGPKGHAIRALVLYDRFVFGGSIGGIRTQVARVPAER